MLNLRSLRVGARRRTRAGRAPGALSVLLASLLPLLSAATCGQPGRAGVGAGAPGPAAPQGVGAESARGLVAVWSRGPYTEAAQVSAQDFGDWRDRSTVFEQMAAFAGGELTLSAGGRGVKVLRASVTPGFFEVLGARPLLGRVFTRADVGGGRDDLVILGHSLWRERFGSDPHIVGKRVGFDAGELTVVGVMPEEFRRPQRADLPPDFSFQSHTEAWTPLAADSLGLGRGFRFLSVVARLRPGVTIDEARREMDAIADTLERQNPQTNAGWGVHLVALPDGTGPTRPAR